MPHYSGLSAHAEEPICCLPSANSLPRGGVLLRGRLDPLGGGIVGVVWLEVVNVAVACVIVVAVAFVIVVMM